MKAKNLSQLGDVNHPIRMSALATWSTCPAAAVWGWIMQYDLDDQLIQGEQWMSADTGTAAGLAIELWHRGEVLTKDAMAEAIKRVEASKEKGFEDRSGGKPFPRADFEAISKALARYSVDPRNLGGTVLPELMETEVSLELECPIGGPVYLRGHPDQVRVRPNGALEVWDTKFSKFQPDELAAKYGLQLAGYSEALSQKLGKRVGIGGIISLRQYITTPGLKRRPEDCATHKRLGWRASDAQAALKTVVANIARARSGSLIFSIGTQCNFCPASVPRGREPRYPSLGWVGCRANYHV